MGEAKRKQEIYRKFQESIRNGDILIMSPDFSPLAEALRNYDMTEEKIRETIGFQNYLRTCRTHKEKYMGEAERVDQLLIGEGEKDDK